MLTGAVLAVLCVIDEGEDEEGKPVWVQAVPGRGSSSTRSWRPHLWRMRRPLWGQCGPLQRMEISLILKAADDGMCGFGVTDETRGISAWAGLIFKTAGWAGRDVAQCMPCSRGGARST